MRQLHRRHQPGKGTVKRTTCPYLRAKGADYFSPGRYNDECTNNIVAVCAPKALNIIA